MKNKALQWLGVLLLIVIGLIHLYLAQEKYNEARYLGVLFFANFCGSFLAAAGILRKPAWGWLLGWLVAAGSLAGYILSRTAGLPGLPVQGWVNPAGLVALTAEAIFILLAFVAWPQAGSEPASELPARRKYSLPLASLLGLVLVGLIASFWPSKTVLITQDTLETQYGIQVSLVAPTMMGSVIDLRLRILDADKAQNLIEVEAGGPSLLVKDGNRTLIPPVRHNHHHDLVNGSVYYLFYPNRQQFIRRGSPVTLVFGNLQLEPVTAQ
jgi:hypothetical protein